MILYRTLMKKTLFLIFGMTLIFGCQEQNGNEKTSTTVVDCDKLNDLAMSMVTERNFAKSVELIDSAVECDPDNNIFIRNKGMILANAGLYQECINHLEKHSKKFTRIELLSTIAECHFHLNDSVMFDSLKMEVLSHGEQEFNSTKNESNLITYLTMLKKFEGEKRVIETLNSNKDLFTTPDMHAHMLEFLEKVPTLKIKTATIFKKTVDQDM